MHLKLLLLLGIFCLCLATSTAQNSGGNATGNTTDTTPPMITFFYANIPPVAPPGTISLWGQAQENQSAITNITFALLSPNSYILASNATCNYNGFICGLQLYVPVLNQTTYLFEMTATSAGGTSSQQYTVTTPALPPQNTTQNTTNPGNTSNPPTNSTPTNGTVQPTVTAICGNAIIEAGEECDDGNEHQNDGCFACSYEFCSRTKPLTVQTISIEDAVFLSWEYPCNHDFTLHKCIISTPGDCQKLREYAEIKTLTTPFYLDNVTIAHKIHCYYLTVTAPYNQRESSIICSEPAAKNSQIVYQNVTEQIVIDRTNYSAIEEELERKNQERFKQLAHQMNTLKSQPETTQQVSPTFVLLATVLTLLLLAGVLLTKMNVHEPSTLTTVKQVLTDRERLIINHLEQKSGKSTANYIRWETGLPRTSLHRLLTRLENRGLITLHRRGKFIEVFLKK